MATPEAQNANVDNAADAMAAERDSVATALAAANTTPAQRDVLTGHDWITYAMVLGAACIVVGVPLVLLGAAWNRSLMVLIGAVCYTVATVVWMVILGYFTWKVIETGRIAVPLLWRRIRR